jgi:hypothetical protein
MARLELAAKPSPYMTDRCRVTDLDKSARVWSQILKGRPDGRGQDASRKRQLTRHLGCRASGKWFYEFEKRKNKCGLLYQFYV